MEEQPLGEATSDARGASLKLAGDQSDGTHQRMTAGKLLLITGFISGLSMLRLQRSVRNTILSLRFGVNSPRIEQLSSAI